MYVSVFGQGAGFIASMTEASVALSRLLDVHFVRLPSQRRIHLITRFDWVLRHHNEGNHLERDAEVIKLHFLAKHLSEIRDGNRAAFGYYRRQLRRCYEADQYFGLRTEIYMAAGLARRGFAFKRRESPDFEVTTQAGTVFVECGSAHFTKPAGRVHGKVLSVVRQKMRKPYARPDVCLVVDYTNVLFNGAANQSEFDNEVLGRQIAEALGEVSYGAVVLVAHYLEKGVIGTCFVRVDGARMGPSLRSFLDRFYPRDELKFDAQWIPSHT